MARSREVRYKLTADASGFKRGFNDASQALSSFNRVFATGLGIGVAFKTLETALAIPIKLAVAFTAGVGKAIESAADFERALKQSVSIMGELSTAMRRDLAETARRVGIDVNVGAAKAAEGFRFLAAAGFSATASIKALPTVAKFATAGLFDMAKATDILTDAQSALGLSSPNVIKNQKELIRVGDVLVKAFTIANASVEQFGEALTTKAAAAARNAKIPLEETVAVLAAFADQGIKGASAGEKFSIFLRELELRARKNAGAFRELGVEAFDSTGELNNLADIIEDIEQGLEGMSTAQRGAAISALGFQQKQIDVIKTLLGTSEKIREYEEQLRGAAGTIEEISAKQLDNFNDQLGIQKKRAEDAAIALGDVLMPAAKELLEVTGEGITAFQDWAKALEENEEFVDKMATGAERLGNAIRGAADAAGALGGLLDKIPEGTVATLLGAGAALPGPIGSAVGTFNAGAPLTGSIFSLLAQRGAALVELERIRAENLARLQALRFVGPRAEDAGSSFVGPLAANAGPAGGIGGGGAVNPELAKAVRDLETMMVQAAALSLEEDIARLDAQGLFSTGGGGLTTFGLPAVPSGLPGLGFDFVGGVGGLGLPLIIDRAAESANKAKKEAFDFAGALDVASDAFTLLGQTAGGVFAKISGGLSFVGQGVQSIIGGGPLGIISGGLSILGGLFGLFGGGGPKGPSAHEQSVEEGKRLMEEQARNRSGGIDKAIAGLGLIDFKAINASAEDAGAIWGGVFWATIKEKGLAEGIKALMPAFEELPDAIKESGALGAIPGLFGLADNEETAGAFQSIGGLQQVFQGLEQALVLTVDAFRGIENSLGGAFDALIDGGADRDAALAAVMPLLADLKSRADSTPGLDLSPETAALIAEAVEAGFVFPTDLDTRRNDLLQSILNVLRGDPGDPLPPPGNTGGNTGGGGGRGGGGGGDGRPRAATGGLLKANPPFGTGFIGGEIEDEFIVPKSGIDDFIRRMEGGGGQGGNVNVDVTVNVPPGMDAHGIGRSVAEEVALEVRRATGGGPELVEALKDRGL